MRIAIPMENDEICEHFGRTPYFLIVDVEEGKIKSKEVVKNPVYEEHKPGAVPRFLHSKGVDCIITWGMGPRAETIFREWGIGVIKGVRGKVEEVIEKFLKDELSGSEDISVACQQANNVEKERKGNKICITADDGDINSRLAPHFGRCKYFIFYDPDTGDIEAVENPYAKAAGGAGVLAADFLISKGIKAVVTGEVGEGPRQKLEDAGVEIILLSGGRVSEVIEKIE